ncbi:MAG: class I SAM-dependent methyltransferase [Clostridia bacterium]|nr:class I SAM-dependent methyltransferase [Clostridia bacterium]
MENTIQKDYQDINAETIDRWIEEGWEWGVPVSHETFLRAKEGVWDVLLTPTKPVPHEWFGELRGKKVLGLASGGGQQIPIFSALGAECTVLDYSQKQLASERLVSDREGYDVTLVRADMTKPLPFLSESFDLVFHPVSNCYVEKVEPIFLECARVLKPGGVLLCGLDNGVNFITDEKEERILNRLPFNPLRDPEQRKQLEEDDCGMQFSHGLEEQIGGQLKAGFILTDLYEDYNGSGRLNELTIPTFFATRAVKSRRTI